MAGDNTESINLQFRQQALVREIAIRIAAPATGAASEISLAQLTPAAVQSAAGVDNPVALRVLRASFVPDVAVAAAGGTNYGTLTIGQRNGATGTAGTDLTGALNNQGVLAVFAEAPIVTAPQTVAAGQVLTLKNTPTASGGAWQAGTVILHLQQ